MGTGSARAVSGYACDPLLRARLLTGPAMRSAAACFVGDERTALLDALARAPARARGDLALTRALAYCRLSVEDHSRRLRRLTPPRRPDSGASPNPIARGCSLVVLRVVESALADVTVELSDGPQAAKARLARRWSAGRERRFAGRRRRRAHGSSGWRRGRFRPRAGRAPLWRAR